MAVDQKVVYVNAGQSGGEVAVGYVPAHGTLYAAPGKEYVVYLPSMIAPDNRLVVADKLGYGTQGLVFVNDTTDVLRFENGQQEQPGEAARLAQAKAIVASYLRGEKLLPGGEALARQVEQQPVGVFTGSLGDWAQMLARADAAARGTDRVEPLNPRALDKARKTEGFTTSAPLGKREVFANEVGGTRGYTVGTIVHELFHTIESDQLKTPVGHDEKSNPIELFGTEIEAVTEYFARRAAGLDERVGLDGGSCYYVEGQPLAAAMRAGRITHEMLVRAYFLGDPAVITDIRKKMYA
jgi:hypothetical protein